MPVHLGTYRGRLSRRETTAAIREYERLRLSGIAASGALRVTYSRKPHGVRLGFSMRGATSATTQFEMVLAAFVEPSTCRPSTSGAGTRCKNGEVHLVEIALVGLEIVAVLENLRRPPAFVVDAKAREFRESRRFARSQVSEDQASRFAARIRRLAHPLMKRTARRVPPAVRGSGLQHRRASRDRCSAVRRSRSGRTIRSAPRCAQVRSSSPGRPCDRHETNEILV